MDYNTNFRQPNVISVNDIVSWRDNKELTTNPVYQRNLVWDAAAKSYLIDSIMRDFPIPALFIRENIKFGSGSRKTIREAIDGQQRINAILDFFDNKFPVSKNHNEELGGLFFDELSDELKQKFLSYKIYVEKISINDDSIIFDMFARLNTNNIPLNAQELRNAKFTGEFKTTAYKVANSFRELFLRFKTFSNRQLSRMADVEFVSILLLEYGSSVITETKGNIDKAYKEFDIDFPMKENVTTAFQNILPFVSATLSFVEKKGRSIFTSKNYFYDVFTLVGQYLIADSAFPLTAYELADKLVSVENMYSIYKVQELDDRFRDYSVYFNDHKTHSTDKKVKSKRVELLKGFLMNGK